MPQVASAWFIGSEITTSMIVADTIVVGSMIYSQQQARTLKSSLKSLSSLQASAQGRNVTSRDSAAYHQIVYGECRVGGTIVFNENAGPNNEYKHLVIIFAGHEVEGLSGMLLDDEPVQFDAYGNAVGRFAGYFSAFFFNGSEDQTALYELKFDHPDKWTTAHRLRGLAGIYVRLKVNADLFPNGVPNITVICRGKKVFDPRLQQYVWTSNAALCLADYYCDKKHGLGFDFEKDIDIPELIASANVCDEQIQLRTQPTA
jgi:hypothetical protein